MGGMGKTVKGGKADLELAKNVKRSIKNRIFSQGIKER